MSARCGINIVTDGLVVCLDGANIKSYDKNIDVEILLIGGGGGGGNNSIYDDGAGGGGGGFVETTAISTDLDEYSIVVGEGGGVSTNGTNSTAFGVTAYGGGGGGPHRSVGLTGGSGGGGGGWYAAGDVVTGGSGIPGQGYAGGTKTDYPGGGGGGGAGGVGAGGAGTNKAGGIGRISTITGSSVYYAGGGGAYTQGAGGAGGGGAGGVAGTANTGGGGGGGNVNHTYTAQSGGSGIVIVRYAGLQKAIGGTITSISGYTVHKFNASGTFKPQLLVDISDDGKYGAMINGATYSSDNGGCIILNNSDEYIRVDDFDHSTSAFTLEAWLYINTITSACIMKKNTENDNWPCFQLVTTAAGALNGYYSSSVYGQCLEGAISPDASITTGWHHVVFLKDTSGYTTMKLYLDGINLSYTNYLYGSHVNDVANSTKPMHIGISLDGSSWVSPLDGKVAVSRVYNRALTENEVIQNYNALKDRFI